MTKIYPFQNTARWLSLGFLAAAILLGGWTTTSAQEGQEPSDPRKEDPRLEKLQEPKTTHDLSSGEVVVRTAKEKEVPAALSPHHEMLIGLAGDWSVQGRIFMGPDVPPIEMRGVARNEMTLEGRALRLDYKGVFQGKPFVGTGVEGFDLDKGEHFSTWMDNTTTGIQIERGSRCLHEGARHAVTYHGEVVLPESGAPVPTRTTLTVENSTTYTLQQWLVPTDGEETPTMQIIYTRQAAAE